MNNSLKNKIRKSYLYKKYQDLKLFYQYKSFHPSRLKLPNSENYIFTNWKEPRGRAILRSRGNGQPFIKKFWNTVVKEIQPDIILDCGVNYGELLFFPVYKKGARIIGIEADNNLEYFLEKSRSLHPNKDEIEIYFALASDKEEDTFFFVDKEWSGRSSAIFQDRFNPQNVEKLKVQSITIDGLFKDIDIKGQSLLFKIDVEGYEPFVLKGMKNTLTETKSQIGCIEFNSEFFKKINYSPDDLLKELFDRFHLYSVSDGKGLVPVEKPEISFLQNIYQTKEIKTDILLFSDKSIKERLNLTIN